MDNQDGVVDSPQTENLSDVSSDDLREALGTEQADPVGVPQPGQEAEAPQEATEVPEVTEEERLAKRRIRPRTPKDQQVIDLYRSDGFAGSFADASQVIYGQQAPSVAPQQDLGPQVDPFESSNLEIAGLQEEISGLEEKIRDATDNLDTGEALEHQREAMRKEMQIQSLESEKKAHFERQRQQEYDTHRGKAMESRDKVLEQFPVLKNEESLERKQFDHFIQQAQGNPDFAAVFESPRWPELMVKEFVDTIYPQQAAPPQAPQQQAPAMGTQAKVLTSGMAQQPVNAPAQNPQMADMSREDIYALLGQPDGRRVLR